MSVPGVFHRTQEHLAAARVSLSVPSIHPDGLESASPVRAHHSCDRDHLRRREFPFPVLLEKLPVRPKRSPVRLRRELSCSCMERRRRFPKKVPSPAVPCSSDLTAAGPTACGGSPPGWAARRRFSLARCAARRGGQAQLRSAGTATSIASSGCRTMPRGCEGSASRRSCVPKPDADRLVSLGFDSMGWDR